MSRSTGRRIPVTLVTGFLGSGKTTLLNRLLLGQPARRVAALVNDFGELGIDHDLVTAVGDQLVELSNGCICCTINDDLRAALDRVLALEPPVEGILIETTGVADPLPIVTTLVQAPFRARMRVDAILAVADAAHFAPDLFQSDAAGRQIALADVILLNKCDLVDEARLVQVEDRIRILKAYPRIHRTSHCNAPLSLLVGTALFDEQRPLSDDHDHGHHLEADGFTSVSFQTPHPISGRLFQRFLNIVQQSGVFRAKGLLRLDDSPDCHVFHWVGSRPTFDTVPWRGEAHTRIVFIGRALNAPRLRAGLLECQLEG